MTIYLLKMCVFFLLDSNAYGYTVQLSLFVQTGFVGVLLAHIKFV